VVRFSRKEVKWFEGIFRYYLVLVWYKHPKREQFEACTTLPKSKAEEAVQACTTMHKSEFEPIEFLGASIGITK